MGGCYSQQSIDGEAMLDEIESGSVVEQSTGDEVVQNISGQVPAQGGSSEYVGAYVGNDMTQQGTLEPTLPVSNNQMDEPVLRVSPQNSIEPIFDAPIENTGTTSVDQPIIYQTYEEQPVVERTFEEQPMTVPVSCYQIEETLPPVSGYQVEEALPPVSSDVHYDYQIAKEVFDVPIDTTVKTIVDEPVYQSFQEHPMIEQTLHNPMIEEQPVIDQTVHNQIIGEEPVTDQTVHQIFEDQPVHPISAGDHAFLPALSSETVAVAEVNENIQVVETKPPEHDLGIVFEGRTYRKKVFDANLKEYVYVGGDVQPRGGLVM